MTDLLIDWLTDGWLTDWQTNDSLTDSLIDRLTEWLINWLTYCMISCNQLSIKILDYHPFFFFFVPGTVILISTLLLLGGWSSCEVEASSCSGPWSTTSASTKQSKSKQRIIGTFIQTLRLYVLFKQLQLHWTGINVQCW